MKFFFILNLLAALGFAWAVGTFSLLTLVGGFFIGYCLITAYCLTKQTSDYHLRLLHAIWLFFYFHYELVTSSIKVLKDIVTPKQSSKPGFVAMELTAETPLEIFFTANLISLTPGTLSIALSDDHRTLFVHAMFVDNAEATIASLKHFESVILRAFR